MSVDLHCGDSLQVMRTFPDNTFDTVITDSPYGLSFMGKDWDKGVPGIPFWAEMLRVSKPGAMLLAFGGTRTFHRLTVAIEDAGWEIRDCLMWVYGSGFPKSHDVSKAIDRMAGAEREVIGPNPHSSPNRKPGVLHIGGANARPQMEARMREQGIDKTPITAPATLAAKSWDGWGTALKPAWEPIILAMKPVESTFAENALTYGVAGLAIDRARIPANGDRSRPPRTPNAIYGNGNGCNLTATESHPNGRWPSNLILQCLCDRDDGTHDNPECPCAMLDTQAGPSVPRPVKPENIGKSGNGRQMGIENGIGYAMGSTVQSGYRDDNSRVSRFFAQVKPDSRMVYCAKSSRRERNAGLEGMPEGYNDFQRETSGLSQGKNPITGERSGNRIAPQANVHPCVKPLSLCRYLARLTSTPTGGTVLDPFCGSGSIGCAAVLEGRSFVGVDIDPDYVEIARKRIAYWSQQAEAQAELQPALLEVA